MEGKHTSAPFKQREVAVLEHRHEPVRVQLEELGRQAGRRAHELELERQLLDLHQPRRCQGIERSAVSINDQVQDACAFITSCR